jgi:hypothetical protein
MQYIASVHAAALVVLFVPNLAYGPPFTSMILNLMFLIATVFYDITFFHICESSAINPGLQ